jgi:hypothetical protein
MARRSIIDVALRCYPTWWRERYGDEMRATIESLREEGRSAFSIALGLFRDAVRSHLAARGMPRTYGLLATRTKASITTATIPWMAVIPFVLSVTGPTHLSSLGGAVNAGYPFQLTFLRTQVYVSPRGFDIRPHYVHATISTTDWIIGFSNMAIQAAFFLTLMALGIGLAAFRFGIRREKRVNRRRMYLLTWLPVATLVTFVGLAVAQNAVQNQATYRGSSHGNVYLGGGHPAIAAFIGNLEWIVAIGGWLLSMVALAVVSRKVTLPPDTLRFGRTMSILSSTSLSVTFVAVVVWGVVIDARGPVVARAGTVVATYPEHGLWILLVFVLGVATLLSIAGASSARQSWQTIHLARLWDV